LCNVNVVDLLQLMRKIRPLRGRGIDRDPTKGSPRAEFVPVTQLEWVEEEPNLHSNGRCSISKNILILLDRVMANAAFSSL
jgi:hypothetical protein